MLAMRGWLKSLAEWFRLPMRSGFAELDLQIGKLRSLRDSYKLDNVKKSKEQLCLP